MWTTKLEKVVELFEVAYFQFFGVPRQPTKLSLLALDLIVPPFLLSLRVLFTTSLFSFFSHSAKQQLLSSRYNWGGVKSFLAGSRRFFFIWLCLGYLNADVPRRRIFFGCQMTLSSWNFRDIVSFTQLLLTISSLAESRSRDVSIRLVLMWGQKELSNGYLQAKFCQKNQTRLIRCQHFLYHRAILQDAPEMVSLDFFTG